MLSCNSDLNKSDIPDQDISNTVSLSQNVSSFDSDVVNINLNDSDNTDNNNTD